MDIKPFKISKKGKHETEGLIHESKLLNFGPLRFCCVGSSGSGKTFFATTVLPAMIHSPVGGVWLFTKAPDQASYRPLQDYCESHEISFTMDTEMTNEYLNEMLREKVPKTIIYDDLCLTDKNIPLLAVLFKRGRHKLCNVICISQGYTQIPKEIRNNATNFILFRMSNSNLARATLQAMGSFVDKERLDIGYKYICNPANKYTCIFVNMNGGERTGVLMKPTGDDSYELIDLETLKFFKLTDKKDTKEKEEEEEVEEEDKES